MINYNPKDWFTFIFRFSKADTFRKLLPLMIAVSVYSALVAYLELNYLKLSESSEISKFGMVHGVLGFVISLLLVFRTNTAYDRWWEGRKVWGALTNASRNLAMKVNSTVADKADKEFFIHTIPLFADILKKHLRENENFHAPDPILDLSKEKHLPNQIAASLHCKVNELHRTGTISNAQLLLLSEEIKAFTDVCGACERIKNTPIPFTYSVFIKKFIFFYVMTLPLGWVFSLGYLIIPVVALILYAFASLELIAEEIENPFGTDANDLPVDQMSANIKTHVTEILS